MQRFLALLVLLVGVRAMAQPAMGYSSFYWLDQIGGPSGKVPTEAWMKGEADAMVSTGLAALGYQYINVDGFWNQRTSGVMEGIPAQFPSGMTALGTYIHSKGLKYGIYSSPNMNTCTWDVGHTYPGSLTFETTDAATFAGFGVDFLKYDECPPPSTGQTEYTTMGAALAATGRTFRYLVNDAASDAPTWYQPAGGTSVRIGVDIGSVTLDSRLYGTDWASLRAYQNNGHWLDPDNIMCQLTVNNGAEAITDTKCRTQFSHYAILAAPLIIATDLNSLTSATLTTLSNSEIIAVDQDSLGTMGYRVSQTSCGTTYCEVWVRHLSTGWAVELVNRDTAAAHNITVNWSMFGVGGNSYNIRDMWAHSNVGTSTTGYTATAVPAYDVVMLNLTPASFTISTATTTAQMQ